MTTSVWKTSHLCLSVAFAVLLAAFPAAAGGVAVVGTVFSDNGDDDGYADTQETVALRLVVRNTSGTDLAGLTARLSTTDGAMACLTRPVISIGDLSAGEERTTAEAFEFVVPANVERTSIQDRLSVRFALSIVSPDLEFLNTTPWIDLDLDLNVSGGGAPFVFFESFEGGLGAFTTMHLDESLNPPDSDLANRWAGVINADGWRCQYSDPEWEGSASFGNSYGQQCFPNANGAADAFYFGIATDRAFSGAQSLRWNIFLDQARGYTQPTAQVEAVRMIDPVNLGWDRVCSVSRTTPCGGPMDCPPGEHCVLPSPQLTIRHQVSNMDHRSVTSQPGRTWERGVVAAQAADHDGNPIGPWEKLYPFVNVYDSMANSNFFGCTFDPADDGNNEGDFFDPTDPQRLLGPSSTCAPEFSFSHQGDTDAPFDASALGDADGPGLAGGSGIGTWVEPAFSLERFRGRRVRLRFLMAGYKVGGSVHYEQALVSFNPDPGDDGWFIDDVTVNDAITSPATVVPDGTDNSALPYDIGHDTETDGVLDVCDNCPTSSNADQADRDHDGIGDACDACPEDPFNDFDGDGLCRANDNCPVAGNADQADVDADGTGNACDSCPFVANRGQGFSIELGFHFGFQVLVSPDDSTIVGQFGSLANPRLSSMPATGGEAVVLSAEPGAQFAITPDGSTVIFREGIGSGGGLFSVPIRGGSATRLGLDVSDRAASWFEISPDGSRVVYTMPVGEPGSEVVELLSVPPQGGPSLILGPPSANGRDVLGARISSDGSRVLFWRGGPESELITVPFDGGPAAQLNPASGNLTAISAAEFVPEFDAVVFRARTGSGAFELYSVPAGGGSPPIRISAPLVTGGEVGWFEIGPDGTRAFYLADQATHDSWELFQVPILGGSVTRLNAPLAGNEGVVSTVVSPDGLNVAYSTARSPGRSALFIVPVAGGSAVEVAASDLPAFREPGSFRFAPDGSRLVYETDYSHAAIFAVPATGGEVVQLSNESVTRGFVIAPDGSSVQYATTASMFGVPIDGGASVNLSDGLTMSSFVARSHDGAALYWSYSYRLYAAFLEPDADADGIHRVCDCDEDYAGQAEVNDGLDNQCAGGVGFGLVDELPGPSGFSNPDDPDHYSWAALAATTEYEVVRASDPGFTTDCACTSVFEPGAAITERPPEGATFFYLPRAIAPYAGSAGADSAGNERRGSCLTAICGSI